MITKELVTVLAPHAKQPYISALTTPDGWNALSHYGVLKSQNTLAGFLANVMHETNGLIIVRESLNYTTAKRLRQVWPGRFGKKSDQELAQLLRNEHALAEAVYAGRMGNRRGTDDAFVFRGAGYMQTTGREDFIKYGKLCNIDFATDPPPSTDDMAALLVMAAAEWAEGGCNELCENGRFDGACSVINTGNPKLVAKCVGLDERRTWHLRIKQVFDRYDGILTPPSSMESADDGSLRRRPLNLRPWYDPRRWFGFGEEPLATPTVVANPELADLGSEKGDQHYVHFTEAAEGMR
jgi:predicted chitinase